MLKPVLRRAPAIVAALVVFGLIAAAVGFSTDPVEQGVVLPAPIERDLDDILERDTVVVLTSYTSTSYFLYRGEPMGYEYELLGDFAEDQDITFQIKVVPRDSLLYYLNAGVGDIAAARLNTAREDTASFGFTQPLYETRAVVVQQSAPFESLKDPGGGGRTGRRRAAGPRRKSGHARRGARPGGPAPVRAGRRGGLPARERPVRRTGSSSSKTTSRARSRSSRWTPRPRRSSGRSRAATSS